MAGSRVLQEHGSNGCRCDESGHEAGQFEHRTDASDEPSVLDPAALAEAMAELATFAAEDYSFDEMLSHLGEVTAAVLAADGVGVMGPDGAVRNRFVYASQSQFGPLEYFQEVDQAGPCKQAAITSRTVKWSTADAQDRWPGFTEAARAAGVHSAVAAPLISRGRCWGVLDLYWRTDVNLQARDLTTVELLAKVAASYLAIADDRQQAALAQQQLSARLLHDNLTGLANRELIHELIFRASADARRRGRPVALLFIDLDGFKSINDTRGHRAGDLVLLHVADQMRKAVRASDTVSRLSGDEFLILCGDDSPDLEADLTLTALGQRILAGIAEPIVVDGGQPIVVSASVGIAITTGPGSVADLIHEADQAMYKAKHSNADRIVVHRRRLSAVSADVNRPELERELFGALERGELRVHYQPVVDAATGRVVAVEALLRWEHPERGLLSADQFIDIAISNGTIIDTGHWMVREALVQFRFWQDTAPESAPRTIFLNFTPQQLIVQQLAAIIDQQLRALQLPATVLGIEVTEKAFDDARVQPSAACFLARGHPLAIDDFGTGYSSLARLIDLPVTYLKLDRSLISRLPSHPQAQALMNAVLIIANSMGLSVIGEGVENAEQAEYLAAAGCLLQQGYHHGRPEPASKLTTRLAPQRVHRAHPTVPTAHQSSESV